MVPREYPSSRPQGFIGKQPRNSDEGPGVVCFGLKKKTRKNSKYPQGGEAFPGYWVGKSLLEGKIGNFSGCSWEWIPNSTGDFFSMPWLLHFIPKSQKSSPTWLQLFFPIFSILKSQHFRGKLPIIQHLSRATSALRDPCIPPIPKKSSIPKNRDIFLS